MTTFSSSRLTPTPSSSALVSTRDRSPLSDPNSWQVVLVDRGESRKVVLYNESHNTLAVHSGWDNLGEQLDDEEELEVISQADEPPSRPPSPPLNLCPLCRRPTSRKLSKPSVRKCSRRLPNTTKDSDYFSLLSEANSLANTPRTSRTAAAPPLAQEPSLDKATLNTGYFASFFEEIQPLGRGGAGTVHLVRHVLNGEALGLYACKKVAVGDSSPSLLRILREVHLLEVVQHPNIVTYHHAWVENSRVSTFSPCVPTLHILMGYANGGSLDTFILQRSGGPPPDQHQSNETPASRKEKHRMRNLGAVHLLRLDEIITLFEDIVNGLAFLHARNILHLDLKAENVLLHWDEDGQTLLPTCKLSDFGNATSDTWRRERVGGSGTLHYTAPESWEVDIKTGKLHIPDRSTDQWALGLILHLLSFFTLPYHNDDDCAALEKEIRAYPGFFPADALSLDHGTRHDVPTALLRLIARLVHRRPSERPSCEKVLVTLRSLRSESLNPSPSTPPETSALVRSTSPGRAPNVVSKILPAASSRRLPNTATKLQPPSLAPGRVAAPFHPPPEVRGQIVAAAFALAKLISLQRLCRSDPSAQWAIYAVLLSTILDVAAADSRLTLVLASAHFIGMALLGRVYVCFE